MGALSSGNPDDFALVLAAAAAAFQSNRTFAEREVNDVLRHWLAHSGAMLDMDHVELRRWLVDNRLLGRDGFGRVYTRGSPESEAGALAALLEGIDLTQAAHDARERDAAAREQRKRQWERRNRTADA